MGAARQAEGLLQVKPHAFVRGFYQHVMVFDENDPDSVLVCETCCMSEAHPNHQIPEDPAKLLRELFVVMQFEVRAQRVWMTPERDALMLRCAKLLGETLR